MSGVLTGFSSGNNSDTANVTFTSHTVNTNVTDIGVSTTAKVANNPTVTTTQGVAAAAGTTEKSTVTFTDLSAGQSVTVAGAKVTANEAMTGSEVAGLFSGKAAGAGPGTSSKATVSGALANFAAGTANGAVVDFTSSTANSNVSDIIATTTGSTATTFTATSVANTRSAVSAVLSEVLGGSVTIQNGDDLNEIRLSSNVLGVALPTISVSQGSTSLATVDANDPFSQPSIVKTGPQGALAQVVTLTVDDGTTNDFSNGASFRLFIDGVGYAPKDIAGANEATVASAVATEINSRMGDTIAVAAGRVVTITAPTAGVALPHLNVAILGADVATDGEKTTLAEIVANQRAITPTTTTSTQTNVTSAASLNVSNHFAGASEVWLVGTASNGTAVTGVASGQVIGFNAVGTGMTNSVNYGSATAGSVALTGSSSGALTVGNSLTSLSVVGVGNGTTAISLTDGAATDTIATLNVSTTGATSLNVAGLTALATVNSTGAGGLTLASGAAPQKLASITSGDGADTIMIRVATAVDNVATSANETVSASLNSGAGADRLAINVSGPGILSVDAGTGNDLIVLNSLTDGTNTIAAGDGNDEIIATTVASLGKTTINGGAGTDTLRTTTTSFTASDYTLLNTNVTGVETLRLTSAPTALDASKVSMTTFDLRATGSSITEVSSAQSVVLQPTAAVSAVTDILSSVTAVASTSLQSLTLASKGYVLDSNATLAGDQTVFGDDLNVTLRQVAAGSTLNANGNKLAVSISSLAAATDVTAVPSSATISGDLRSIEATLTSARGSAASESIAGVTVSTPTGVNLSDLESIKVSGSGAVTINAGSIASADAKLKVIDLSAMTAFPNQNTLGQNVDANGSVDGYQNLSTSSVTLNTQVAETLTLGAGDDVVTTGSTVLAMDSIRGFSLVATAADSKVIDVSRSDELNVGGADTTFVKMTTTASTLNGALIQAAGLMSGSTHQQNVVFHFNGNTYVYVDTGAEGLTDGDRLIELVGLYDLDLLISGTGATKALKGGGGL